MPTWIKKNKEEYTIDEQYEVVDINSFSEMQKLAYDIVKSHFDVPSSEGEPLCLIINGVAGTGKSYLINAIRNLFTVIIVLLLLPLVKQLIILEV